MKDGYFKEAAIAIKAAIVRSRFHAASHVNKELLALYYSVGKFVSDKFRGINVAPLAGRVD